MPRTRVQRSLDFPVRKTRSTRVTRSQKLHSQEDVENSPVKVVKSPKRRIHTDENVPQPVQCSPLKKKRDLFSCTPTKELRIPLSPLKITSVLSPSKHNILNGSPLKLSCTPSKQNVLSGSPLKLSTPKAARSLDFSPVRTPNCATPQRTPLKKGRALDFSTKENEEQENCPSPKKIASPHVGTPRPKGIRVLSSPLRLLKQEGACYQRAKKALHTALPDRLVCREEETAEIQDFLDGHLQSKTAGSLYISGAPGTGKTAVLSHTMQRLENNWKCSVYINCMSFKNSQAIYNRVLCELKGKETAHSAKRALLEVEKALTTHNKPIVMILDEMDQLDSRNQEVLYTMFEWPSLPKSKLILVGIANALDLTDRILPRLQARPKCKPQLLHFAPYTKDQIITVLKERLSKIEVEGEQVMEPSAIQFCARKVSAVAGDIRKALDVCRRAVEMVEADVRKQQVLAAGSKSPRKKAIVPKKIGVSHILKIVNEVYGSRMAAQSGQQQTIPLQQKLAVCSLLLMLKHGKSKEVMLGKLHECYSKVCARQNVGHSDQSEFTSLCTLLESRGLINMKQGKGGARGHKVSLKLDEKELEVALQDKTLITSVLQQGLPK